MAGNADIGKIGWIDITVDDAGGLRDFYAKVVGWKPEGRDGERQNLYRQWRQSTGTAQADGRWQFLCH
jgi:predicted enzyme related to lactoylglutathione lyase